MSTSEHKMPLARAKNIADRFITYLTPVFDTEEKFFNFIGVEYIHPKARSWVSNKAEYNYSL